MQSHRSNPGISCILVCAVTLCLDVCCHIERGVHCIVRFQDGIVRVQDRTARGQNSIVRDQAIYEDCI